MLAELHADFSLKVALPRAFLAAIAIGIGQVLW
jgi:hypothetical protein